MKNIFVIAFIAFVSAHNLSADVLTLTAGPTAINGVNVSVKAAATIADPHGNRQYALTTLDAGLRTKKVSIFLPAFDVYVGQLFASDPASYVRSAQDHSSDQSGSLDSLGHSQAVAFQLDFTMGLSIDQMNEAFSTALSANNVNLQAPEIVLFLKYATSVMAPLSGSTLTIVGEKFAPVGNNPPTETVTVETISDPTSQVPAVRQETVNSIPGPAGFSKNVFSMVLGVIPADDAGLVALKTALTQ